MAEIKLFVSDCDGTITNGNMTFDHEGNVSKSYLVKDCTMLWLLKNEQKIKVLVLTGSKYPCDVHRFKYLADNNKSGDFDYNILHARAEHLIQGVPYKDKFKVLNEYRLQHKVEWSEVAYIGDDLNDYQCLTNAGYPGCPRNAHPEILELVHKLDGFVSDFDGGEGAVWEFGNKVIQHNQFTREYDVKFV